MCWHADNASQATMADAISTRTMALDDNTTRLDTSSMGADASGELDNDDEIERAIREINDTIKKLDKR